MEEVIKRAILGNEKAFEKLMLHYLQDIYSYLKVKVNNEADIKDLIQDIMLAVYKGIKKFEFTSTFKTWILAISRYKIADYYRNKYADISTVPIEECPNITSSENHDTLNINEVLELLPDDEKELLNLVFIQQCSYKEVAQIMEVPVGTIKSRMFYLKEKLKPVLESWR